MSCLVRRASLICIAVGMLCSSVSAVDQKMLYDKSMIYGIDFKYGMDAKDPRFPALRQAMLDMSLKYGATVTRAGIGWAGVEGQRGQEYNWTQGDRKTLWLSEQGLPVCVNLMTAPEWAIEPTPEIREVFKKENASHLICGMNIRDAYWPEYEKYITAVVGRYGEHVTYYDIWNEPDGMGNPGVYTDDNGKPTRIKWGGDPEWYVNLLKHTTPILRKLDPDCIIGGGCLENKGQPTSQFLEDVYKAGGGPYFDAISMHPYGRPFNFNWIRAVRNVMVKNGDAKKPVWLTEFGLNWQKNDGISEEAAAALTRASLRYSRETHWLTMNLLHHAGPILWNEDPNDRSKLTPKPALIAFKETRDEKGPARRFEMGFEKDWDLTHCYYEFQGSKAAYPYVTLTADEHHSGGKALRAATDGAMIEPFIGVNVKAAAPVLSFWYKVAPTTADAKVALTVEARPGNIDILPKTFPVTEAAVAGQWVRAQVKLTDGFPQVAGKTIVDIGIKAESTVPGVTLYLDDVSVK